MLQPAIKYANQLQTLQHEMWFNEKYMFWNGCSYYDKMKIEEGTWNKHQFVSVKDGKVLGYISYDIDRDCLDVHSLSIINFSDNKFTFGKDLRQALVDIFEKYKFHKLMFVVIIGNPMEKTYDKMIKKYNGRIVGTYKEDVKLIDGNYYDKKLYEILRSEYLKTEQRRNTI